MLRDCWADEQTKIWIRPYRILVTGPDSGMIEPIISTAVTPCVHTEKRKVRVALANTTHSSNAKTADTVGVQMSIKHIRRASGALKCNVSIVIYQDSGV